MIQFEISKKVMKPVGKEVRKSVGERDEKQRRNGCLVRIKM